MRTKMHLALTATVGLLLGSSPALAQNYNETVIVHAPRPYHAERDSVTGAPFVRVSLSRAVNYGDLDLRTRAGAYELRQRVLFAAQTTCRQLNWLFPITQNGSPPCFARAVRSGMRRADAAIMRARYS